MKKIAIGAVALFALFGIFGNHAQTPNTNSLQTQSTQTKNVPASTDSTAPSVSTHDATPTPAPTPALPAAAPAPAAAPVPAPTPKTCSAGYYLNTAGNCIQSPTTAPSAPAGATAECRDGTYSFSQSRSGTCSHHGGVASWL